jgi:ATP adenylyltransferase
VFSPSLVEEVARSALATGALEPIETDAILLAADGVRFVVRAVSSVARKAQAWKSAGAPDPLGDYDPALFVAHVGSSHYVLLNKYPVVAGHALIVTRHFESQQRLLTVEDFAALGACLGEMDGLGFYNGGPEAGSSQPRKHLQLVPLPLTPDGTEKVPIEAVLGADHALPFRHSFACIEPRAGAAELHALYRALLERCGVSVIVTPDGAFQSAPYNLLVRRMWMLAVPRSVACFESIMVNALGFAGSLIVRTRAQLERVRAVGPMHILREVAVPPIV